MVFDAGDVEKVRLERSSSSFQLTVVNKSGDRKVYSPRGFEVVRASESLLERVGRLLERLDRDHPAAPKAEATDKVEVGAAVSQDIDDYIASIKGKRSDDED